MNLLRTERLRERERERVSEPLTSQSTIQEKSNKQTVLQQDMMAESAISRSIEPVLLSNQASKFEKKLEIASTLLARDYKGLGNQAGNAVIEKGKE